MAPGKTSGQEVGNSSGENLIPPNIPTTSKNSFRLFYETVGTSSGKSTMLPPSRTRVKSVLPRCHTITLEFRSSSI